MNTFTYILKTAAEKTEERKSFDKGVLESVKHAIDTLDDDPGNHKHKALLGLGGAAASASLGAYVSSKIPRNVTGPKPNAAAALAIPAGLYYAANNMKDKTKALLGVGVAGTGLVVANKGAKQSTGPVLTNGQRLAVAGSLLAPTALTLYGLKELKQAEAIQRERQAVATSTNPVDGVDAIHVTKNASRNSKKTYKDPEEYSATSRLAGSSGGLIFGITAPAGLGSAYWDTKGLARPNTSQLSAISDDDIKDYMGRGGYNYSESYGNTHKFTNDAGRNIFVAVKGSRNPVENTVDNWEDDSVKHYRLIGKIVLKENGFSEDEANELVHQEANLPMDVKTGDEDAYISLGSHASKPILAHEFGHTYQNSTAGAAVAGLGQVGSIFGTLGTSGLLLAGKRKAARNTAIAGTAAGLGYLYPELEASYLGAQNLDTFSEKLHAFAGVPTYALAAATPLATYYAGSKIQDYINNKQQRKDN